MAPPSRSYLPEEIIPGTVYRVVRLIGAGGMGTVYDVEDTTIGKRYVLKTLHPQLGQRQDLARRLQNEARTIARLNHPNIVEVVTAGMTADDLRLPFYVMERLNGQSLRFVLEKKGRLELVHSYRITIDLLDALDHAHDKGVVHRDVKPDNLFLHRSQSGATITKLLDFGIVSLLDGGGSIGDTRGHFLGTLRYAAPEQLRGEKPTPKVDLYAAGLVLYEMIAGVGPFDDEADNNRLAAAHMNRVAPPLSRFAPVPHELEKLVRSALEKNPDNRPRDAFSFAASLRNFTRVSTPAPPDISRQTTVPVVAPLSLPREPVGTALPPPRSPTQTLLGLTAPGVLTPPPSYTADGPAAELSSNASGHAAGAQSPLALGASNGAPFPHALAHADDELPERESRSDSGQSRTVSMTSQLAGLAPSRTGMVAAVVLAVVAASAVALLARHSAGTGAGPSVIEAEPRIAPRAPSAQPLLSASPLTATGAPRVVPPRTANHAPAPKSAEAVPAVSSPSPAANSAPSAPARTDFGF